MGRLVLLIGLLTFLGFGFGALPENRQSQTGDDGALKRFLIRYNRLPYSNETVSGGPIDQAKVKDWTTCEGCKLLVVELRDIIKNPAEVDRVKELLSRFCSLGILAHYKTECLNMVDNLIVVLHEIEPLLDNPTAVCQELKYCPESLRGSITPAKHLALLLGFKAMQVVHRNQNRSNDVPCDECIFAITELKSLIQSAQIQAELKQELHKLCRLAGQYESECSALVDQYFDLLIQEAVQLLSDGRKVCVEIGFCASTAGASTSLPLRTLRPAQARAGRVQLHNRLQSSLADMPQLQTFLFAVQRMQTRQGINAGCLVCRGAFTEVFKVLSEERVATMVTKDLTNFACGLLPESMKVGCTDFMKIYSRAFLQQIVSEYTPAQICAGLGICKPGDERKIEQLSPTENSAAVCEACQVLSQYLSFEFQQRDFQQEVINTLKSGCGFLPGDYRLQVRCQTFAQTYLPYILENIMAPGVVAMCPTLGMCPGQANGTTAIST